MKRRMFKTLLFFTSVTALMCIMLFSVSAKTVKYKDFTFDVNGKTATVTAYKGKASKVTIPKTVKGATVKAIGLEAFWSNKTMKSISIPSTVTSIGIAAFNECTALEKITIPSKVTKIGESAFWYCSNLKTAIIPKSVKTIGKNAFKGCKKLTAYVIKGAPAEKQMKQFKDVKLAYRYITSLKLASTSLKLAAGSSDTLKCTISPSAVYNKKLTYTSSDKKVATVDSKGKIRAVGCGKATITVKTNDGSKLTKKCTVTVTPAKVTSLSVTKKTVTGFTLKWSAATGATKYKIYRYNSKTKKWDGIATTDKLTYTVKNLAVGTSYKYKVRAYTKVSKSTYSGAISSAVTATTLVPSKVTSLKASAARNYANLSWAKADNATGYDIYSYNESTKKYTYKASVASTKLKLTALTPGTKYSFAVKSFYELKGKKTPCKDYSSIVTFTTRPDYIKGLAADSEETTHNSITLKWNAVKGAAGYRVQMWDDAKKEYKALGNVSATTYVVKNLAAEKEYKFTVKTYIKDGTANLYGYNCDALTVKTKAAPPSTQTVFNNFLKAYNDSKSSKASLRMFEEVYSENVSAPGIEKYEPVFTAVFSSSSKSYKFVNGVEQTLKKTPSQLVYPYDKLCTLAYKSIDEKSIVTEENGNGDEITFSLKSEDKSGAVNSLITPVIDWDKIAKDNKDFVLEGCTYSGTTVNAKIQNGKLSFVTVSVPVTVNFRLGVTPYSFSGTIVRTTTYIW